MLTGDNSALLRRLNLAARQFDAYDFLHQHCAAEIRSRLGLLNIQPRRILDLGATTGAGSQILAQTFTDATVIAAERSAAMLQRHLHTRRWYRRAQRRIVALHTDLAQQPLGDNSVDLVFSNLTLPRYSEPDALLREVNRVLRPDGAFVFATVGPDTLAQLRQAWQQCDDDHHVAPFTDMHDVGDALGRAGLREPVLDVEHLQLNYKDSDDLWRDLGAIGARNSLPGRRKTLTGKGRWQQMLSVLTDGSNFAINVELVFGQCWGGAPPASTGDIRIPAAEIGRRV